jgi:hypothetical protein
MACGRGCYAIDRRPRRDSAYAESLISFRFGQDDLLRTRFAIAPLMELVGCVYALRDPAGGAVHRPWAEWTRPRTAHLDLSLLEVATPSKRPFYPVFIGPPPRVPHATVASEFE